MRKTDYTIKVCGIISHEKTFLFETTDFSKRFKDIDEVIEHIIYNAWEFKNVNIHDFNLLEPDSERLYGVMYVLYRFNEFYHDTYKIQSRDHWDKKLTTYLKRADIL